MRIASRESNRSVSAWFEMRLCETQPFDTLRIVQTRTICAEVTVDAQMAQVHSRRNPCLMRIARNDSYQMNGRSMGLKRTDDGMTHIIWTDAWLEMEAI